MADGAKILCVDDEVDLLEVEKQVLEQTGEFSVDTAISASEALDILKTKIYDAIVSDYVMSDLDGIQFLKNLRVLDTNIPFILFTGRGREEVAISALNSGANFYLQKDGGTQTYAELIHFIRTAIHTKRTRMTLAEQEQRFLDIQNTNDLIQTVDAGGRFQFVNKKWLDTLGYREDEVEELILAEIIHDDCKEQCMEMFHQAISGRNVGIIDAIFRTRDGEKVYVEGMATCRLVEGKCQHIRAIFKNVTERKIAEKKLLESEKKLQESKEMLALVMNGVPAYLSYVDPFLRLVYVNRQHATLFGHTEEEQIGKKLKEVWPKDVLVAASPFFRKVLQGEEVTFECTINTAGGRDRSLVIHMVPHISGGRLVGFFTALNDITSQKVVEDALRKSRQQLEDAMETARLVSWEYDPVTGMFILNDRFFSLFGTTAGREGGYTIPAEVYAREFVHPDDRHSVIEDLKKAMESTVQEHAAWREARIIRRDGETRNVAIFVRIIRSADERRITVQGTIQDTTELKQAEEALRQANRKLNLLSSITRHDITNQLMVLNGYVELIRKNMQDPAVEPFFSRITKSSSQIAAMIRFTKEYEKIGVTAPAWQNLKTLITCAGKSSALGKVTLDNEIPPDAEVFADPLIIKVFFNLIDNALRHGGKITTIRFRLESREGDCTIVCEDNGDGIAAELKERIFDRGFGKNTGFGLFISRDILGITGITIRETGEPGSGARFEILLPRGSCRANDSP
jgi:PAS domain S-box-containing protein